MKTRKYLWLLLTVALLIPLNVSAKKKPEKVKTDRELWTGILYQMAAPVLSNMSEGKLQENMLVELSPTWDGRDKRVTYMECFGRLMAGLAPWLSLPDDDTAEGQQRKQLREWALKSYAQSVDPESKDYLLWRKEGQPLVDAAYIAESFLRGYDALWVPLDDLTKQRYIAEFQQLRRVDPPYTNWLLFSSTVECFLKKAGAQTDYYRITSALRKVDEWYVGDGWYSDGEDFAFDYYNSFVLHPMYVGWRKKKHLECERRKLPESFEAYAAFRYDIGTLCFSRRCFPRIWSFNYLSYRCTTAACLVVITWLATERIACRTGACGNDGCYSTHVR